MIVQASSPLSHFRSVRHCCSLRGPSSSTFFLRLYLCFFIVPYSTDAVYSSLLLPSPSTPIPLTRSTRPRSSLISYMLCSFFPLSNPAPTHCFLALSVPCIIFIQALHSSLSLASHHFCLVSRLLAPRHAMLYKRANVNHHTDLTSRNLSRPCHINIRTTV